MITPSIPVKHDLIVGGGTGWGQARDREMLPTLAVSWWASALRGEEAGRFCKVAGVSIVDAGGPCLRHTFQRRLGHSEEQ